MNQHTWEAQLRIRLGSPSTTDVLPEATTLSVMAALKEYGKYKGPELIWSASTTKDKSTYTLPSDCLWVLDAWWNMGSTQATDPFNMDRLMLQHFDYASASGGGSLLESPSLLTRWYQQVESLRKRFEGRWQMTSAPTGGGPEIYLEPPTESDNDTLWVLYRKVLGLEHVLASDEEPFMDACLWKACEIRSQGLSVVSSASLGGGSMQFGGKAFEEKAEQHRSRFINRMPPMFTVLR